MGGGSDANRSCFCVLKVGGYECILLSMLGFGRIHFNSRYWSRDSARTFDLVASGLR